MPLAVVLFGAKVSGTLLAAIGIVVLVAIGLLWYFAWYLPRSQRP